MCSLYTPGDQTLLQGQKKKMNVTHSEAICHSSLLKGAVLGQTLGSCFGLRLDNRVHVYVP